MGILNETINVVITSKKIKGEKDCLNVFELFFSIFKVLPLVILFFYVGIGFVNYFNSMFLIK
jgi:type III secretory pathway component EscU